MKRPPFPLPALFAVMAMLCSCAPAAHHVPFDETAFVPYRASGLGSVSGRASGLFYDKQMRTANHAIVKLMPDNAYTEEIVKITLRHTNDIQPPDPRFPKYVREATTDGNGNFAFNHVPPGNYYVTCRFVWPFHTRDPDPANDGSWVPAIDNAEQTLYARVSVGNGQSVRVGNWSISEWFALPMQSPQG